MSGAIRAHSVISKIRQMRKLSERERRHCCRRARQGIASRTKRRNRRLQRPLKLVEATLHGVSRSVMVIGEARTPPEILCIDTNRAQVLDFLAETRERIDQAIAAWPQMRGRRRWRRDVIRGYWDFTKIKFITPDVALVVAAEYDRAAALLNYRVPAIDIRHWHPAVAKVMSEVGFFDLLEINDRQTRERNLIEQEKGSLRVLRMRSSRLAEPEKAGQLINELEELAADLTNDSEVNFDRLYGALFEGITNTRHHAYPDDYEFKHTGQWWATGSVDEQSRTISAIIYDQGVTIPASLPRSWMAKALAKYGADWAANDGASIAAAMQVSRSSTKQPNRGLGLAEMEAFMETCTAGRLRILSRYGEYQAKVGERPQYINHREPLRGTLVQWDVTV